MDRLHSHTVPVVTADGQDRTLAESFLGSNPEMAKAVSSQGNAYISKDNSSMLIGDVVTNIYVSISPILQTKANKFQPYRKSFATPPM